jgi:hypothetical protein
MTHSAYHRIRRLGEWCLAFKSLSEAHSAGKFDSARHAARRAIQLTIDRTIE